MRARPAGDPLRRLAAARLRSPRTAFVGSLPPSPPYLSRASLGRRACLCLSKRDGRRGPSPGLDFGLTCGPASGSLRACVACPVGPRTAVVLSGNWFSARGGHPRRCLYCSAIAHRRRVAERRPARRAAATVLVAVLWPAPLDGSPPLPPSRTHGLETAHEVRENASRNSAGREALSRPPKPAAEHKPCRRVWVCFLCLYTRRCFLGGFFWRALRRAE